MKHPLTLPLSLFCIAPFSSIPFPSWLSHETRSVVPSDSHPVIVYPDLFSAFFQPLSFPPSEYICLHLTNWSALVSLIFLLRAVVFIVVSSLCNKVSPTTLFVLFDPLFLRTLVGVVALSTPSSNSPRFPPPHRDQHFLDTLIPSNGTPPIILI